MPAYVYSHNMGWGWGVLMTLGWLILLGLFVALLFAAIRERRESPSASARELLDRRLAAGEISIEEYERARVAMGRHPTTPDPSAPT